MCYSIQSLWWCTKNHKGLRFERCPIAPACGHYIEGARFEDGGPYPVDDVEAGLCPICPPKWYDPNSRRDGRRSTARSPYEDRWVQSCEASSYEMANNWYLLKETREKRGSEGSRGTLTWEELRLRHSLPPLSNYPVIVFSSTHHEFNRHLLLLLSSSFTENNPTCLLPLFAWSSLDVEFAVHAPRVYLDLVPGLTATHPHSLSERHFHGSNIRFIHHPRTIFIAILCDHLSLRAALN